MLFITLFLLLNIIYLDLLAFSDSLLGLSHSDILFNSLFILSLIVFYSLFWLLIVKFFIRPTTVVSSAYIINLNRLLTCGRSLIYIMNSKGPSMEP